MKTFSAVLVAAACLAVAVLPASAVERPLAASENPAPVSIELSPGSGIWQNKQYDRWEARSYALFSVKVTDRGDETLYGLSSFVSVPYEIEITGYEGEGWTCRDNTDDEGYGIYCDNTHQVVPGEAWPVLTVRFKVLEHMNIADSIDVYASTGRYGDAHAGVPFKTTTST